DDASLRRTRREHNTVVPAKAGTHFDFAFSLPSSPRRRGPSASALVLFAKFDPTSLCVSSRIPARRLLLFACPKRSNQEKGHPWCRGRRLQAGDSARPFRRFADGTSLCRQRTRAHPARAPTGFCLHDLAAPQGDPEGKKSAAVLAAEAGQRRCARCLLAL